MSKVQGNQTRPARQSPSPQGTRESQEAPRAGAPSPARAKELTQQAQREFDDLAQDIATGTPPLSEQDMKTRAGELRQKLMDATRTLPAFKRENEAGNSLTSAMLQLWRAREALMRNPPEPQLARMYLDTPAEGWDARQQASYPGVEGFLAQVGNSNVLKPSNLAVFREQANQLRTAASEAERTLSDFTPAPAGAFSVRGEGGKLEAARQYVGFAFERVRGSSYLYGQQEITNLGQDAMRRLIDAGVPPEKALAVNNAIGDYWRMKRATDFPSPQRGELGGDLELFQRNAEAAGDLLPPNTAGLVKSDVQAARKSYQESRAKLMRDAPLLEQVIRGAHAPMADTFAFGLTNNVGALHAVRRLVESGKTLTQALKSGDDVAINAAYKDCKSQSDQLEKNYPDLYGKMSEDLKFQQTVLEWGRDSCKVALKALGTASGRPALGAVLAGAIDLVGDLASANSWEQAWQKTLINVLATAGDAIAAKMDVTGSYKKELIQLVTAELTGALADYSKAAVDINARQGLTPEQKSAELKEATRNLLFNFVMRLGVAAGANKATSPVESAYRKAVAIEVAKFLGFEKALKL